MPRTQPGNHECEDDSGGRYRIEQEIEPLCELRQQWLGLITGSSCTYLGQGV